MLNRAPNRAMEAYYTVADLMALLRVSESTVRRKLKGGFFSPGGDLSNIIDIGEGESSDIRIPASGVNFFLDTHPYKPGGKPIKARSVGELKRRARGLSGVQTFGLEDENGG